MKKLVCVALSLAFLLLVVGFSQHLSKSPLRVIPGQRAGPEERQRDSMPHAIPVAHEFTSSRPPWDDTLPLVYAYAPGPPGFLALFGQGVADAAACSLDGRMSHLVDQQGPQGGRHLFLCELHPTIRDGALLTVVLRNASIVPSSAVWNQSYTRAFSVPSPKYYVCAVTQIRNMAYMVGDWLEYHNKIGIDQFYVYDNNGSDDLHRSFGGHPNLQIIPWPWRRSQAQAYTHATIATQLRCAWLLFMDVDQYFFPQNGSSVPDVIRNVTAARSLGIGGLRLRSLRMMHNNDTACGAKAVPETYLMHQRDAWEPSPNSMVRPGLFAVSIHRIHTLSLIPPLGNLEVPTSAAFMVHFSDRCWAQYFTQKMLGRGSVPDWHIAPGVDERNPPLKWFLSAKQFQNAVVDVRFRDFWRSVKQRPVRAPLILR